MVNFFRIFEINLFCFDVIFDLMHDLEAIFSPSFNY